MTESVVLASYSEIALKSSPVRRRLETLLTRHIKNMLKRNGINDAIVERIQGRLKITNVDSLKASEVVSKRVFGVASTMPAKKISNEFNTICNISTEVASEIIQPNQTFAIRARRTTKQDYTSRDIEVNVGARILERLSQKGVRVNLNQPDKIIFVEAREDAAYIYHQIFHGVEGLPFGSQGKIVSLLSGGIDSPVATWLMMKRGAYVIPLFLDQRPFIGDDYFKKILEVATTIRQYVPMDKYTLYVAPMGEIMQEIANKIPAKFICVICKRMMYRIACGLAMRIKAEGIVTGENLGQVASQTLANLKVLDDVSSLPIYRPLISSEKREIIELAKKIGTYAPSTVKVHGCIVVPSKPATKAKIDIIQTVEKYLDVERLISQSLDRITMIPLNT